MSTLEPETEPTAHFEDVEPSPQMPAEPLATARIARGTFQIGLPGAVITLLSVFDVIHWDELQTTAVLAFAYQVIQVLMNVTTWGRKVFAP